MSRRVLRWWPVALATLIVLALAYGLLKPGQSPVTPLVGQTAPAFSLPTLRGGKISLAALHGRPVVVNFWASWCVPCQQETPTLERFAARYGKQAAFLGVTFSDPVADARRFVQQYGISYPVLIDHRSDTAINYGVTGVPETFFINAQGVIVYHAVGPLTAALLRKELARIGVAVRPS
jgi:cytochrome c biogenesis protein CcmG/thiol:disulfide interchange protein DsbE